jgi:hypothetical protein
MAHLRLENHSEETEEEEGCPMKTKDFQAMVQQV